MKWSSLYASNLSDLICFRIEVRDLITRLIAFARIRIIRGRYHQSFRFFKSSRQPPKLNFITGYIFSSGLIFVRIKFLGGKKEKKKELYWTNIRTWKDQRYDDRGNEDGWWAYLGRTQGSGWSWQRVPGAERTCRPGPATAPAPDRAPPRRIGPRTQAPLESPM